MDPSDAASILILLLLLILSAFFSSAETSLTTVNKLRMRSLAEEGNRRAKIVCRLIESPSRMLSAVLICNNVVNLSASSFATTYTYDLCRRLGLEDKTSLAAGISTGVLTILVLIFGEITPKSLATIYAEKLSLAYANSIYFITTILTPIIFIVNKMSTGLLLLCRIDVNAKPSQITEDELRTIVDVSHEEGVIESEERQMITNVVDFGDSLAKDIMVPRMDVEAVSVDSTMEELMEAFAREKYSRLPVYGETVDDIVGIVNLKDIFFFHGSAENFKLEDLLREAYFTYEYKKTSELLVEMRRESISMSIVLDEYGAFAGIVSMEDLIEEIVGEIRDEFDADEEDAIQKIGDREYLVDGSTNLNDINEAFGWEIEGTEYDSIGGHIINLLEHLPEEGEVTEDSLATYKVVSADKNRVDKVHIHLKEISSEEDDE